MVEYFDGSNIWEPFGPAMADTFDVAKERLNTEWDKMPKDLPKRFPATFKVMDERDRLLEIYAPSKTDRRFIGRAQMQSA